MIKIHDKLWFIVKNAKDKNDKAVDGNLAYMCQYELNKTGGVSSSTASMQRTGRRWVGNHSKGYEEIVDNTPVKGIYVGSSVSRWSTSNKLFRVEDPRGFTVEIPTDNLSTVLHHTTVVRGVIQEECVWGRDGGNHILLPVNSEPYILTRQNQDTLENKLIPISNLDRGDIVKFFGDTNEYHFYGRVKLSWSVTPYRARSYNYWNSSKKDAEYAEREVIEDDKYLNLFLRKTESTLGKKDIEWKGVTPTSPKIIEILGNEVFEVNPEKIRWVYCPERVTNKASNGVVGYYNRFETELVGIKHKPVK